MEINLSNSFSKLPHGPRPTLEFDAKCPSCGVLLQHRCIISKQVKRRGGPPNARGAVWQVIAPYISLRRWATALGTTARGRSLSGRYYDTKVRFLLVLTEIYKAPPPRECNQRRGAMWGPYSVDSLGQSDIISYVSTITYSFFRKALRLLQFLEIPIN